MIEPLGKNLVFLFSVPRAGSTLLSAILGGHSKVLCPNEPWFLLSLQSMYDEHLPVATAYNHQFARAGLRDLTPRQDFIDAARRFAIQVYNDRLKATGKEVFVDKTPRYHHAMPFIQELFPEAKKIWLKRNLLDSAASFKSTWTIGVDEMVGEKTSSFSFDLTLGPKNFAKFFDAHPGFELRYEDLVEAPETEIDRLCGFLEIEREKDLSQYASDNARVTQMAGKFMGDKKVFQHSKPHRQSVGTWQKHLSHDEAQKLLNYVGEKIWLRMGYADVVKDLRGQGFTFPSEEDVEARQEALRKIIASCDFFWQQRFFPPSSSRNAKLKQHWWIELGKKLGFNLDALR